MTDAPILITVPQTLCLMFSYAFDPQEHDPDAPEGTERARSGAEAVFAVARRKGATEKLGGDRLNFQPISYRDAMNREQKMYRMDRLAFSVLVSRFTGTKALAWQLEYHRQFALMESQLQAKKERFASALDQIRPWLRPVVEATEQGLSRAAIAVPLGKSPGAITYHRRQARRFGLM